jgi:hypothetical protein
MDKVQKHNLFHTNTPLSESYRNYLKVRYQTLIHRATSSLGSYFSLHKLKPSAAWTMECGQYQFPTVVWGPH